MTEVDVLGFNPQDLFNNNNEAKPQNLGSGHIYRTRPADVKPEIDKNHIYRATIKVIYNPENLKQSFLEQQSYAFNDANGFFSVVSKLTLGGDEGKDCPIFKAWKKCRYAKQNDGTFKSEADRILWLQQAKKEEGGKQLFDKRQARYVLIQILEDKNQPELEGSFKIWKLPTSIYDLIKQKQDPSDKKKFPIPVMDFLFGRSIDIEVKPGPGKPGDISYTREVSYSGELSDDTVCCINPDKSPLLTSEEQEVLDAYVEEISKVWKMKANTDEEIAERLALKKEIDASDNTKELRKIYAKAIAQIKEWAPKLDSLSYKEWTPEVAARVNNWINIVLEGNDPQSVSAAPAAAATVAAITTPSVSTDPVDLNNTSANPEPTDETSDLPF